MVNIKAKTAAFVGVGCFASGLTGYGIIKYVMRNKSEPVAPSALVDNHAQQREEVHTTMAATESAMGNMGIALAAVQSKDYVKAERAIKAAYVDTLKIKMGLYRVEGKNWELTATAWSEGKRIAKLELESPASAVQVYYWVGVNNAYTEYKDFANSQINDCNTNAATCQKAAAEVQLLISAPDKSGMFQKLVKASKTKDVTTSEVEAEVSTVWTIAEARQVDKVSPRAKWVELLKKHGIKTDEQVPSAPAASAPASSKPSAAGSQVAQKLSAAKPKPAAPKPRPAAPKPRPPRPVPPSVDQWGGQLGALQKEKRVWANKANMSNAYARGAVRDALRNAAGKVPGSKKSQIIRIANAIDSIPLFMDGPTWTKKHAHVTRIMGVIP